MSFKEGKLTDMIGLTMTNFVNEDGWELRFVCADGRSFIFFHEGDCCETVRIEDVCGDLSDLVGSPLFEVEEVSNYEPAAGTSPWETGKREKPDESFSWTFYRFSTVKGTVTVRWLGESNGYYSESVSLREEAAPESST